MTTTKTFAPGGYRYIPGPFQYSAGVRAEPGFDIERVRFARPMPVAAAYGAIEDHLRAGGRPTTALCACEMRSPAQFSEEGFVAFNREYVATLAGWGLYADEDNPVARSNVCPEADAPAAPSIEAFCYTVPATDTGVGRGTSFVIAGSGETVEGAGPYRDHIVRLGEVSADALRDKARFVLAAMESRMGALGVAWRNTTTTQVYTVHDIHPFLADEIVARGAAHAGVTWHYARPPVTGLEFEMDARGLAVERVIPG